MDGAATIAAVVLNRNWRLVVFIGLSEVNDDHPDATTTGSEDLYSLQNETLRHVAKPDSPAAPRRGW